MRKGEKLYFGIAENSEYAKRNIEDIMKIEDFIADLKNDYIELELGSKLVTLKIAVIGAGLYDISDEQFDKILSDEK